MIAGLPLGFAQPLVLLGLLSLPVLWWLLRLIPPSPRRVDFPDPVNPPTVAPFGLTDNPHSPLDVADVELPPCGDTALDLVNALRARKGNRARSAAGLAGNPGSLQNLPAALPLWAGAVVVGGVIGSGYGSRHIGTPTWRRLLGGVLVIAGAKLIFS